MRADLAQGGCTEPSNQPHGMAVVYYEKANTSAVPSANSVAQVDNTPPCENDALSTTIPAHAVSAGSPSTTITMNVGVTVNSTGHLVWTINDSPFHGDYNAPVLLLADQGNVSYPDPHWNVYNVGTNATIRVVVNNHTPTSHPWHLHGHEM